MVKKKVLVCGATGFLGRNIAERFSEREDLEVYGSYFKRKPYENPKIKMVWGDLRNEADVKRIVSGMDILVQMAATTTGAKDVVERPYIHVTDNAVMNSLLLRAAFENSVSHFIFPSCTVMYPSSDIPAKETDNLLEINPKYFGAASTKLYIEKMCDFFSRQGKTKHTVIRHSNIYGPYDKFDLEKSHVFGATVNKIMNTPEGEKIRVWGDGQEKRDLLYVSDLVNFVENAMDNQKDTFGLYNVGYGNSISTGSLVEKMINISGKELSIDFDRSKPTIKTDISLDISKAERDLGWIPRVSLDEGIKKTLEWYLRNYK